jgi:UV DNA damage endonuclease
LRASPDADEKGGAFDPKKDHGRANPKRANGRKPAKYAESGSSLSDVESEPESSVPSPPKKVKKAPTKSSIAAKKGSDEIKAFKAEQAAKNAAAKPVEKEEDEDETFRPDPEADDDLPAEDLDTIKNKAARPPPVNSDYLPLPWKGSLGYVSFH